MTILRFSTADHYSEKDALFLSVAKRDPDTGLVPSVHPISWPIMWSVLERSDLGDDRFDVSEIGSTWVASFAAMGAIAEIGAFHHQGLDNASRFVPSAWRSVGVSGDERRFAVPYLADTRVIYYWKDALESVGADDPSAFGTTAKLEETLSKLKNAGEPTWGAPTFAVTNTVHQIASWIRFGGGDFFSPDGTRTAFTDDAALAGIVSYFTLQKYMEYNFDSLDSVLDAFEQKEVSVIISGPWFYRRLLQTYSSEAIRDLIGTALPPGPPFVGGSALVLWKGENEERAKASLEWIARLTDLEAQEAVAENTGLLPVIREAFDKPPYTVEPHYQVLREALRTGRPLPQVPYWGALETELVHVFGKIWSDLKENPRCSPEEAVLEHLVPAAHLFDGKLYRRSMAPTRKAES